MGKYLDEIRNNSVNNIKIGFCLELSFRQNLISDNIHSFIKFLEDNKKFIDCNFLYSFRDSLYNLSEFFYNYTDILFYNVDPDCNFMKYHKDLLD